MGLIKAALGAAGGVMADQWKEYFYCEAIPADVLAVKGQKRVSGTLQQHASGSDNIITNGCVIAVADGQCMLIVEQGKVVEVCAEPGEFTYDTSTEPSIFSGDLGDSIEERLPEHRQALYLRRRGPQGSARLLLQHQGADGQQVRHPQSRPLPRGGPAGGHRSSISASAASVSTASG